MSSIRVVAAVCWCVLSVLRVAASRQQPDPFESLLALAQDAQARSDFPAAAEFYRQAISLHPGNAELRTNLGLMYYQTGKDQQAIDAFSQAIRLKPALFVPNLFLGLDYVKLKRFNEAVPYLKQAAVSKPTDTQVQLALGQAYRGSGGTRLAIASYLHAVQLDPGKADAWFQLGMSYLEQVESDARVLLARHKDSAYLQALVAQTFSEQRALIQAGDAYKKLLTLPTVPPDTHASYGWVLINRHDLPEAGRQLNAELASNPGSLMAKLGLARLQAEQGGAERGAKDIEDIWNLEASFLRANAPLFNGGLANSKRSELQHALEERTAAGAIPAEVVSLFQSSAGDERPANVAPGVGADSPGRPTKVRADKAAELYASGRYSECSEALATQLQLLQLKQLQLLAFCAYSIANYQTAVDAAQKLALNARTEAEGLYWETRSAQKLAAKALARASQIDSNSPKLHVLLGDIYRQRKLYAGAEQEYRKALTLEPDDSGGLFGLSLTLFAVSDVDGALSLTETALRRNADDPEFNALMGEIRCFRHDFSGAEPYLKKALNAKPELLPHVHALLGKTYAETNRTQQAIAELKLGLADDKDGHVYFQIARLYLKVGDRDSAKQAFEVSARRRREGLTRAAVAMEQGEDQAEPQ